MKHSNENIIKVTKSSANQLAQIDFESEHQNARRRKVSKSDMKKEIMNRFNRKHELFFAYKMNNELIGYITLKPSFPGYKHSEIYWLAVKKKYQGMGIGSKLVKFIENYAKKKGFRKVCIYTGKTMNQTRKFYAKLGYKLVNEFPDYYGYKTGNRTAVLYLKSLK
ncbi:MAG: GNAT family N-acetyltransferase [Candidatus Aenigmatarchaeota archaeon]